MTSVQEPASPPLSDKVAMAHLNHELRTPVNAIAGFIGLIRCELDGPVSPGAERAATLLEARADEVLDLVDAFMEASMAGQQRTDVMAATWEGMHRLVRRSLPVALSLRADMREDGRARYEDFASHVVESFEFLRELLGGEPRTASRAAEPAMRVMPALATAPMTPRLGAWPHLPMEG